MKIKFAAIVMMVGSQMACAQGAPPSGGTSLDHSPLFKELDKNGDGKVTKVEWNSAGAPEMVLSIVDTNNDGEVTLAELNASTPPSDMDTNKDGKVSLAEMKAFVSTMGGGADGGQPAGGGQPPSGSAPK